MGIRFSKVLRLSSFQLESNLQVAIRGIVGLCNETCSEMIIEWLHSIYFFFFEDWFQIGLQLLCRFGSIAIVIGSLRVLIPIKLDSFMLISDPILKSLDQLRKCNDSKRKPALG